MKASIRIENTSNTPIVVQVVEDGEVVREHFLSDKASMTPPLFECEITNASHVVVKEVEPGDRRPLC